MAKARSKTLIADGWESYRRMCVPDGASEVQLRETRQAFYAGASVLFVSMVGSMGPGDEPTPADMSVMTNLQAEIDAFGQELDRRAFGGLRDN